MCGILFLFLNCFVFFHFTSCKPTTSGPMYSSSSENGKTINITLALSKLRRGDDLSDDRRIDRSLASIVVVAYPPCLWSKSKSKSRSLSPSSSFIVVVVGCRRRWLSTASQINVVVHHRCRSWSWSWQTSRSSSSPSSAVVVRCHHDDRGYKRQLDENGIAACAWVFPNITIHTRTRSLLAPCMSGELMVRRWRNGKSGMMRQTPCAQ